MNTQSNNYYKNVLDILLVEAGKISKDNILNEFAKLSFNPNPEDVKFEVTKSGISLSLNVANDKVTGNISCSMKKNPIKKKTNGK